MPILFGIAVAAGWVGFGVLSTLIAIRLRRPRIEKWVESQGLTLKSCRFTLRLSRPNLFYFRSVVPFRIEVEDKTGHVIPGTLWVSGFIRRDCTVEWGRW